MGFGPSNRVAPEGQSERVFHRKLRDMDLAKVSSHMCPQINFAGRPFYMAGITGFKVALCLAYLRIVHRNNRFYKTLIWSVGVFAVLTHMAGTLVLIFQCKPVSMSSPSLYRT